MSSEGVGVKMVGSEAVTLIVLPRVGAGPRGYFQWCVTAVRTGGPLNRPGVRVRTAGSSIST